MTRRVQLKRTRGWKMPPRTLKVDRTTRWGNPFRPDDFADGAAGAVAAHAHWLRGEREAPDGRAPPTTEALRAALGGFDLACWCPLDGPCHADLLLALAGSPADGGLEPSSPPPARPAAPPAATASPPPRRPSR